MRLAVSARTLDALPYRDELAGQVLLTTREAYGARPAGRLAAADVAPLVEATPDADVFVCGSAGFAEAASRLLVDLGVQPVRRTRGAVRAHRLTRAAGPKPGADPGRSPEAAHPCPSLASQAPSSTRGRCPDAGPRASPAAHLRRRPGGAARGGPALRVRLRRGERAPAPRGRHGPARGAPGVRGAAVPRAPAAVAGRHRASPAWRWSATHSRCGSARSPWCSR